MQKLFLDTRENDSKVRDLYGLTEDIMMENAAAALENAVIPHAFREGGYYIQRPSVLILAGSGNNGADGYALARRLMGKSYSVTVCAVSEPSSAMCVLQQKRAKKAGVYIINPMELDDYIAEKSFDLTVIVDCIFGSGFRGSADVIVQSVLETVNNTEDAYKIACDIPTGIDKWGNTYGTAFRADVTITMGALKLALYSDEAKDLCGKIELCNLGVSRTNFEHAGIPYACVLEQKDMELPLRNKQKVNKGSFGHSVFIAGKKSGAGIIAATASFNFGSGLVTVVNAFKEECINNVPCELMTDKAIPLNAAAVAIGMGFGRENPEEYKGFINELLKKSSIRCVLDADAFYYKETVRFIEQSSNTVVLTPHPKEFASLLELCGMGSYTVEQVVQNRYELVSEFCKKYEEKVLLLKGANPVIGVKMTQKGSTDLYINSLGSASLAKGGSGDVLTGLICALLSQKYSGIQSAVYASLAHAAAGSLEPDSYSLTPLKLIQKIADLNNLMQN